jgi:hypothetical protein
MIEMVSHVLAAPPFPNNTGNPVLTGVGDWLQAVGSLPSLYFVLSYGVVRPLRRKYEPWWKDRVGTMIFMLGLALFAISVVVTLSLFLGIGYPGREIVRIAGYAIFAVASFYLVFVYELEANRSAPHMWALEKKHRNKKTAPVPEGD